LQSEILMGDGYATVNQPNHTMRGWNSLRMVPGSLPLKFEPFHVAVWMRGKVKAEAKIKGLGIMRDERHPFQILQIRMIQNAADQPRPQTLGSALLHDVDIAEVRKSGVVGDYPRQTNLPVVFEEREAE
jgi:hypothetical protein